jgi:xylulose-5-phosphate/fructose-6-phosphate phosphoketolase
VAQLYLQDNFLLTTELRPEHLKSRILGHWGTVPGLNLIYAGLNLLVKQTASQFLHIVGPGHGAPSTLSNLYLEGTLAQFYPEYQLNQEGLGRFIKNFSWPGGFPSHAHPGTPGNIHEGGELGYSLGVAFGAAFDHPELVVSCVIGDGEAETGALAASWHSNKFLHPIQDGAVLPILHLNGYKISGPTIFGCMDRLEIDDYFEGLGWEPIWADQYQAEASGQDFYQVFMDSLVKVYQKIRDIQTKFRQNPSLLKNSTEFDYLTWPVLILKTKKGWTGPALIGSEPVEDNNLSHGIPLKDPRHNSREFEILKQWLESYQIRNFLNTEQNFWSDELFAFLPEEKLRIGRSPYALGGNLRTDLHFPDISKFSLPTGQSSTTHSEMSSLSDFLAELTKLNPENFLIFSPDESESNKLESILRQAGRKFLRSVRSWDHFYSPDGRMLEILSEQVLQSWMQGYTMTGRHGILISYEAFLNIILSQIDQYLKFLKKSKEFSWRTPLPSLNYIATSTCWRQDHNGFSHQNPDLINYLITQQDNLTRIYFPTDVNTTLYAAQTCLSSTNQVNLIVNGKTDLPQWLSPEQAQTQIEKSAQIWDFATNSDKPEVVLCSVGDYQTLETLAGISLLKQFAPSLKFRYVNLSEITWLKRASQTELNQLFTSQQPVVINFHGYPEAIQQLLYATELSRRTTVIGYQEEGTTTTPFDMQIVNGTSRWHVASLALELASQNNPQLQQTYQDFRLWMDQKLAQHQSYIIDHGDDLPEIKNWHWT